MVRKETARAMDRAHGARCDRLVYGNGTSIAVVRRSGGVALAAASLGLLLLASLHFFGFLSEATTILSLALVGVGLVSGFPAHHPRIYRLF